MKIKIKTLNNDFKLEATNEEGNTILMDSAPEFGGSGQGMRPMQLLLSALGGCSAIDVIHILKKQKSEGALITIEVEGDREKAEEYSLFKNIVVHFIFNNSIDYEKAKRAVKLSLDKYCSVAKTLAPTANISYKITIIH
jgi:putative redox protein